MPTNQEVFDRVVRHLRKQGKKSLLTNGVIATCAYRAPDGSKCAVGCLIPDHAYTSLIEHSAVMAIAGFLEGLGLKQNLSILNDLQAIHDITPIEDWESAWYILAQKYKITYTPPTKIGVDENTPSLPIDNALSNPSANNNGQCNIGAGPCNCDSIGNAIESQTGAMVELQIAT